MVSIDQACSIGLSAEQRSYCFPFAPNVVPMFAPKQVKFDNGKIPVRLQPLLGKNAKRDQRGLWGVRAPTATRRPFRSATVRTLSPARVITIDVRSRSVSRIAIASADRPSTLAIRSV